MPQQPCGTYRLGVFHPLPLRFHSGRKLGAFVEILPQKKQTHVKDSSYVSMAPRIAQNLNIALRKHLNFEKNLFNMAKRF